MATMWQIDLTPYLVKVPAVDDNGRPTTEQVDKPFDVKGSCYTVITSPALQLNGPELVEHALLGLKIRDCPDPTILLSKEDLGLLQRAVEKHRGFSGKDLEFIQRIIEAKETEVSPKPSTEKNNKE